MKEKLNIKISCGIFILGLLFGISTSVIAEIDWLKTGDNYFQANELTYEGDKVNVLRSISCYLREINSNLEQIKNKMDKK